jgi:hypothetical protein
MFLGSVLEKLGFQVLSNCERKGLLVGMSQRHNWTAYPCIAS